MDENDGNDRSSPATRLSRVYDRDYYHTLEPAGGGSVQSAEEIAPILIDLLHPASVVDVGCGVGSWLKVFMEHGVEDVLGVDLDAVDRDLLLIPKEKFLPFDLNVPLRIERTFDLVLCLEVAGELPETEAANLVHTLSLLGPIILFSAPIPLQGGSNLANLQWPEYWAEHFRAKGYVCVDCLRREIWNNPRVKWWFAQNALLYVREDVLSSQPRLVQEISRTFSKQLALVHPRQLLEREKMEDASLKRILSILPKLVFRAIRNRWRRF